MSDYARENARRMVMAMDAYTPAYAGGAAEAVLIYAESLDDRLAALEREEDRKKSPPDDPMGRKIVPIDGAIEAARHAKPDPRKQYAIADIDAIRLHARDEALEEAAMCLHSDMLRARIRALKSNK